jgi:hypothetical protein
VPEQELNLFKVASGFATELRASSPEVVRPKLLNANLLRGLLDDLPYSPVAQAVTIDLPSLSDRQQQSALFDVRRGDPGVDSLPNRFPACLIFGISESVSASLEESI